MTPLLSRLSKSLACFVLAVLATACGDVHGELGDELSSTSGEAVLRTRTCASVDCIRDAMADARPGDEIVIEPGTYRMTTKIRGAFDRSVYLYGSANGTASNPITLRGASSSDPSVLQGRDYSGGYLLSIDGDHWRVEDLAFRTGSKGIVLDNADHGVLRNVAVYDIGEEGIHLRDGSSFNTVDGCRVYDTGQNTPAYGEGLYVGSDRGQHDRYAPDANDNVIENCTIGPNVRAEGVDVKEGTERTVIRNNTFSAAGLSGENSADAFIDLKGAYGFVYGNTFNRDGSTVLASAVDFLDRGVPNSGYRNAIFANTLNLGSRADQIPTARRKQGSPEGTHVWDNDRNPDSPDFPISNGTEQYVTQSCPSWNVVPCGSGGGGDGTTNAPPSVSFAQPGGDFSVAEGYDIEIAVAASDSDGEIAHVRLFVDGQLVRQENQPPYTWGHGGSPDPDEVNGLPVGTHAFRAVATDDDGATAEARFTLTVTSTGGGGGSCTFGTPLSAGLPALDTRYANVHVLGSGGPSLGNFRAFSINWDPTYDGLYVLAINTDDGQPSWYVNLLGSASWQLQQARPEVSLSGTGFAGLDGAYWVAEDDGNFVMVSKQGGFTLYFSGSASPPSCG